jgi:maltose O-acetyltransferase
MSAKPNTAPIAAGSGRADDVDASMAKSVAEAVARIREDWRWAWTIFILCTIGGSMWTPRILRRLIFSLAGASMDSAPGIGFVIAGSPRNLSVGSGVYMNQRVFVGSIAPVSVGNDCAIGMEVLILTSHHPIDKFGRWQQSAQGRPVTIGDRVWIGARAVILPGAVIESDVVIAASAVVSGHCRSGGLYAGVPARRIRDFEQLTDS